MRLVPFPGSVYQHNAKDEGFGEVLPESHVALPGQSPGQRVVAAMTPKSSLWMLGVSRNGLVWSILVSLPLESYNIAWML